MITHRYCQTCQRVGPVSPEWMDEVASLLPERAFTLVRGGYTVDQLRGLSLEELMDIRGIGWKYALLLRKRLHGEDLT